MIGINDIHSCIDLEWATQLRRADLPNCSSDFQVDITISLVSLSFKRVQLSTRKCKPWEILTKIHFLR